MNLSGRLVAGTIIVLCVAMAVLLSTARGALRRDLERELGASLEREARVIAAALPADSQAARDAVHRLGREYRHRITLIDPTGRVVADGPESRPLRRATVTLSSTALMTNRLALTSDDGTFVFDGLPAGTYGVSVYRAGYMRTDYGARRPGGEGRHPWRNARRQCRHAAAVAGRRRADRD